MNKYPKINSIHVLFVVAISLVLPGCVSQVGYGLPNSIANKPSQLSADVLAVNAVVEEKLRGQTELSTKGVTIAATASTDIAEPNFRYQGFTLKNTELIRYGQRPGKKNGRIIAGKLGFEDEIGRRVEVLYYADYLLTGDGIRITNLQAAPLYSTFPESLMFLLPAQAVIDAGGLPQTHSEILAFVSKHAIDWNASASLPNRVENYIIVTFLMDRVSPSAQVELKISDTDVGEIGYKNSSKYLDILGWRIGIAPGGFNLNNASFFVKVVFLPGDEVNYGGRYKRVIGLYPLDLKLARQSIAKGS